MRTQDTAQTLSPLAPRGVLRDGADERKRLRARKRLRVRLLVACTAALLVATAVVAAWPRPVPVEEAVVRSGMLEATVDESGKTRVRDRYVVHAPLGGDLMRISLRAGDAVTLGGTVAQIVPASPALLDPRARAEAMARVGAAVASADQMQAQVSRADAALAHARQDLETTRRLVEGGSLSPDALRNEELDTRLREQELAAARFGAQAATHDVDVARTALLRYGDARASADVFTVSSPVAGRVLRVDQESAGVVMPGASLLELGDPASLEVVVEVLTADAVRIAAGAPVRLERWGGDAPLRAHVRVVEPSAFTKISALGVEEQRTNVLVDIDDPRELWQRLGDGYRVEASIVTWRQDGVTVVPASATFRRGEDWAAFVDVGGRATLRSVKLGQRGAIEVQVLSGLSAGDRVVVHPSSSVTDGVRIGGT